MIFVLGESFTTPRLEVIHVCWDFKQHFVKTIKQTQAMFCRFLFV